MSKLLCLVLALCLVGASVQGLGLPDLGDTGLLGSVLDVVQQLLSCLTDCKRCTPCDAKLGLHPILDARCTNVTSIADLTCKNLAISLTLCCKVQALCHKSCITDENVCLNIIDTCQNYLDLNLDLKKLLP